MNSFVLHLGWSLVLAWLVLAVALPLKVNRRVAAVWALLCAVWAWMPGSYGASYWLGLAFQTPSLLTQLLCAWSVWRHFQLVDTTSPEREYGVLLGLPVVVGWVLLFDTFAVFPESLYAQGTAAAGIATACALSCVPWLFRGTRNGTSPVPFMGTLAVILFAATRLPTGNVWDAALDPLLWIVLNVLLLRWLIARYQKRS